MEISEEELNRRLAQGVEAAGTKAVQVQCPVQWTNAEKHAWDMAAIAFYKEIRRLAAALDQPANKDPVCEYCEGTRIDPESFRSPYELPCPACKTATKETANASQ